MNISEFKDLCRVAYITGNVKEALDAWQALERVVEIANSVQRLKAEITTLATKFGEEYNNVGNHNPVDLINELRQLTPEQR